MTHPNSTHPPQAHHPTRGQNLALTRSDLGPHDPGIVRQRVPRVQHKGQIREKLRLDEHRHGSRARGKPCTRNADRDEGRAKIRLPRAYHNAGSPLTRSLAADDGAAGVERGPDRFDPGLQLGLIQIGDGFVQPRA